MEISAFAADSVSANEGIERSGEDFRGRFMTKAAFATEAFLFDDGSPVRSSFLRALNNASML